MIKHLLLLILFSVMSVCGGCRDQEIDVNGVPIVTDVKNIKNEKGEPITAQTFLDKWCPGQNGTPVMNPTCVMVRTQRDSERNVEQYQNSSTPQKW